MIVVVCLNPALDITHRVTAVHWGGVNRPTAVHARPGGKGLNVARTLHALGADLLLMGLVGGITGAAIEAELGQLGVPAALTPIAGETRRTFTSSTTSTGALSPRLTRPAPRSARRSSRSFAGSTRGPWPAPRWSCCPAACRPGSRPGPTPR